MTVACPRQSAASGDPLEKPPRMRPMPPASDGHRPPLQGKCGNFGHGSCPAAERPLTVRARAFPVSPEAPEIHIVGILPARWASTRFPGKPLHLIAGKPLVQHVWEQCRLCKRLDDLYIATDDERIFAAAEAFGAKAVMTSPVHPTGTDRIAEAVRAIPKATHIVNIQG